MSKQRYPVGDPDDWTCSHLRIALLPAIAVHPVFVRKLGIRTRYNKRLRADVVNLVPIYGVVVDSPPMRSEATCERHVYLVMRRGYQGLRL